MKLLVGRKFDDPDVQAELARYPFKAGKMAHGGVGIYVSYNDEQILISAEHYLAMMLVQAKTISEQANAGASIGDAVLSVPHWFTNSQRKGLLQACEIAQLNCLKVTNDSNAIALSFGIFKSAKKLFSETEPTHVMFVDLGYTGFCVTIVDFIQENMKVLSTVCERGVSGRDFDDAIVNYLIEAFEKKTKINVRNNKKAILKLQTAAEKAKKTLSPAGVTEAAISVECLAEDIDLNVKLTRDDFEASIAPFIAKMRAPIEQCLAEAGLTREQLAECEIVGGSTRVNIVKRTIAEILGTDLSQMNYGLKTTMNADEAVARGAALQCAMLSSRMKVKPFHIVDRIPYGIVAHFDHADHGDSPASEEGEDTAAKGSSVPLYQRNDEFPHKPRRVTFRGKTADFAITLTYDDAAVANLPTGESRFIGKYTVKIPSEYASAPHDVRVTFNLDRNMIVAVQSAELMEEVKAEETKAEEGKESKEGDAKEGEAKKKFRKVALKVDVDEPGLTKQQIKEALELEASMAYEDRLIVETADKKNEVEAYIYAMREKLDSVSTTSGSQGLKSFVSSSEKDNFNKVMNDIESWLYDEGYETTKQEYERKLSDLKKLGNPIEARAHQHSHRPGAIDALKKQIELCKGFTANYDEAHSHITEEERDKLRKETSATEDWLYDQIGKQGDLPLSVDPVLTVEQINYKRTQLFNVSNPIMTKPKPKPVETKKEEPKPAETKEGEAKTAEGKEGEHGAGAAPEENKGESK